ncbi:hypothetical protein [Streptomyces sp. NRRL S-495]|uniref:hypothetical protein n=1 Tax=Streptomyces sp. NRRL S-495 TaxID=1609133 RepID=UPI001331839D|nr:hypothetical protein [Streptomyces sp. NRRL S-495]
MDRHPATGREGLPPVALVLEAGRKRTRRPGAPPRTAEQKKAKAKADRERLLRRVRASRHAWHAPAHWEDGIMTAQPHPALPVVATTGTPLRRFGAADLVALLRPAVEHPGPGARHRTALLDSPPTGG